MRYSDGLAICVPLSKTSWIIGPYRLEELNEHQYRLDFERRLVHVFYSRQAAIFYGVLIRSHNPRHIKLAKQILNDDTRAGKLHDELMFYSRKISKDTAKSDGFKLDLWRTRRQEIKLHLKQARQDLQKNLDSAKYIKVWSER